MRNVKIRRQNVVIYCFRGTLSHILRLQFQITFVFFSVETICRLLSIIIRKFKLNRNYKQIRRIKTKLIRHQWIKSSCKQFHYILRSLFGVACHRQKVIHHNAKLLLFGPACSQRTCCSCCCRCATRCTLDFSFAFDSIAIAPIRYQCIPHTMLETVETNLFIYFGTNSLDGSLSSSSSAILRRFSLFCLIFRHLMLFAFWRTFETSYLLLLMCICPPSNIISIFTICPNSGADAIGVCVCVGKP